MSAQRLGNILLDQGLIDAAKLDFCLKVQKNNGGERIGKVLKHYDFVGDEHIALALAQQVGWDVYRGEYVLDDGVADLFGADFLLEHGAFPVRMDDGAVFVLCRNDDIATTDIIQTRLDRKVRFLIGAESHLRHALERSLVFKGQVNLMEGNSAPDDDLVVWVDRLIDQAVVKTATDIHIEPSQKAIEVRYRVDGILYFVGTLRLQELPRLMNIIFHKADVTVSDFGHFHDARFSHSHLGRSIDIRISHIPSINGSSLVLRLLDRSRSAHSLTSLGYGHKQWEMIERNLSKPEGLTLVVGPTGSGKTTTLYAMLNHLKSISRKIVTIEDPVEMHLSLMTQVQMNEKRGMTFGNTVRAFLRHDPNIILIGEIRDQETAREAIRASMTGHKVFATVHANRPVDAILRLNDLGVPYTHLAGNLTMIVAQRLVRKLNDEGALRGRVALAEILAINDEAEEMICRGDIASLRKCLKASLDHISFAEDAGRLVNEGITTRDEIRRVLG